MSRTETVVEHGTEYKRTRLGEREDEFGEIGEYVREESRHDIAYVSERNGAWLINVGGPLTDYAVPDDLFDCAGSLRVAKRVAREIAAAFGYEPAWRWERRPSGSWVLSGKIVEEREMYVE